MQLLRLVRAFGAWVEATPRGLFERIEDREARAADLAAKLREIDLAIELEQHRADRRKR